MQCPSCGQYSAEGKFCTNCGAQLIPEQENVSESSLQNAEETTDNYSEQSHETADSTSDVMDQLKNHTADFGHFFTTLVKNPNEAKKANHSDISSGIITIILFALLLSASYHFVINAIPAGFFGSVSIFDSFFLPLIIFALLQFLIAGLTFAGAKLAAQEVTFADTIAKYGARLIPFTLLYAAGLILGAIGLPAFSGILIMVSLLGLLILAPTFIILEQPATGLDPIYILAGMYIIVVLVCALFSQSFLNSIIGNMMDSMLRGF